MSDQSDVRGEDAFDLVAMDAWLRGELSDLAPGLPTVTQFTRGASNLTYRLAYPDRELVLRRPPAGTKAASAHDMGREVHVLTHIRDQFPYVPQVKANCTDPSVIGSPFYVMDYIEGIVLRPDTAQTLSAEQAQSV